jgi:peptidylprolyl isomerase
MKKALLSIGVLLLLALSVAACGGDSSTGSGSSTASSDAEPFRISTETPIYRYAKDMKRNANGLSGKELQPNIPDSPPPDFLVIHDSYEGIGGGRYGDLADPGDKVEVQYAGYVYDTGKKFASSWDEGKPFVFTLGKGEVIEGWEEGMDQIEAGDRREMVIPPDMTGGGSRMKAPEETVFYVVEALRVF